jgi:general secretion pathway protein D
LGDVPLLGYLFRSTGTDTDKRNLMVFIHPTILRDQTSADRYTASKYNFMRTRQLESREDGVPLMPDDVMPALPPMDKLLELPPPFESTPHGQPETEAADGNDDG